MNPKRADAMRPMLYYPIRHWVLLALCLVLARFAATEAQARDKGPVDVSTVNDNLLGPWQRKDVVIEGTVPSDEKDAFHYLLLLGNPMQGQYDWFKIARKTNGTEYYLILGSNDGSLSWVEDGVLTAQKEAGSWRFVLTRTLTGEMETSKSNREFSWSADHREIAVKIVKWSRFFLNPFWGQPTTETYNIKLRL